LQRFDPAQGEIADANFRPFPVVRFSKSFSSATGELDAKDIRDLAAQVERSVLVVQAGSFLDFLGRWDIGRIDGRLTQELFGT
jgi:hypothetical protein